MSIKSFASWDDTQFCQIWQIRNWISTLCSCSSCYEGWGHSPQTAFTWKTSLEFFPKNDCQIWQIYFSRETWMKFQIFRNVNTGVGHSGHTSTQMIPSISDSLDMVEAFKISTDTLIWSNPMETWWKWHFTTMSYSAQICTLNLMRTVMGKRSRSNAEFTPCVMSGSVTLMEEYSEQFVNSFIMIVF